MEPDGMLVIGYEDGGVYKVLAAFSDKTTLFQSLKDYMMKEDESIIGETQLDPKRYNNLQYGEIYQSDVLTQFSHIYTEGRFPTGYTVLFVPFNKMPEVP